MSYFAIGPAYRKLEARAEMLAREKRDARRRDVPFRRDRHREIISLRRFHTRIVGMPPSVGIVLAEVAAKHGVTVADIRGAARTQRFCVPRHEATYRLKVERRLSLHQIGGVLGGRDHTTCLHSIRAHCQLNGLPLP